MREVLGDRNWADGEVVRWRCFTMCPCVGAWDVRGPWDGRISGNSGQAGTVFGFESGPWDR